MLPPRRAAARLAVEIARRRAHERGPVLGRHVGEAQRAQPLQAPAAARAPEARAQKRCFREREELQRQRVALARRIGAEVRVELEFLARRRRLCHELFDLAHRPRIGRAPVQLFERLRARQRTLAPRLREQRHVEARVVGARAAAEIHYLAVLVAVGGGPREIGLGSGHGRAGNLVRPVVLPVDDDQRFHSGSKCTGATLPSGAGTGPPRQNSETPRAGRSARRSSRRAAAGSPPAAGMRPPGAARAGRWSVPLAPRPGPCRIDAR